MELLPWEEQLNVRYRQDRLF